MSVESQTPMFSGSEAKSLDPKFRLTIPMKFKEQLLLDPSGAERVVVSRWETREDWERWRLSKERSEIQKKIEDLTQEQTEYTVYAPMVPRKKI